MPKNEKSIYSIAKGFSVEDSRKDFVEGVPSTQNFYKNYIPVFQRDYVANEAWIKGIFENTILPLLKCGCVKKTKKDNGVFDIKEIYKCWQTFVVKENSDLCREIIDGQQRLRSYILFCIVVAYELHCTHNGAKITKNFMNDVEKMISAFECSFGDSTNLREIYDSLFGKEILSENVKSSVEYTNYNFICALYDSYKYDATIWVKALKHITVCVTELEEDEDSSEYYVNYNVGNTLMQLADFMRVKLAADNHLDSDGSLERAGKLNHLKSYFGSDKKMKNSDILLESWFYAVYISIVTKKHIHAVSTSNSSDIMNNYTSTVNVKGNETSIMADMENYITPFNIICCREYDCLSNELRPIINAISTCSNKTFSTILVKLLYNHYYNGETYTSHKLVMLISALAMIYLRHMCIAIGASDNFASSIDDYILDDTKLDALICKETALDMYKEICSKLTVSLADDNDIVAFFMKKLSDFESGSKKNVTKSIKPFVDYFLLSNPDFEKEYSIFDKKELYIAFLKNFKNLENGKHLVQTYFILPEVKENA